MALSLMPHEVTTLDDDALPPVLDIYQQSFPLREQMPFSWWIGFLREKGRGEGENRHLVTLGNAGQVVVFAYYEEDERADYLWYLASRPDARGQGAGARLYQEVAKNAFDRGRSLLIDVELPAEAARFSMEEEQWAHRRIAWYRRNGARLLGGIEYIQDVGWQPPYPMGLMVASPHELSPESAFGVASSLLGDEIRQTGPLTLS